MNSQTTHTMSAAAVIALSDTDAAQAYRDLRDLLERWHDGSVGPRARLVWDSYLPGKALTERDRDDDRAYAAAARTKYLLAIRTGRYDGRLPLSATDVDVQTVAQWRARRLADH
jgi:hypothetical protein